MPALRTIAADYNTVRRAKVWLDSNDGENMCTEVGRRLPGKTALEYVSGLIGSLCFDRLQ